MTWTMTNLMKGRLCRDTGRTIIAFAGILGFDDDHRDRFEHEDARNQSRATATQDASYYHVGAVIVDVGLGCPF